MPKFLIVGNDTMKQVVMQFMEVLGVTHHMETKSVNHDDALLLFLEWRPDYTLILNAEAGNVREHFTEGNATYKDLAGAAEPNQKVLRTGFMEAAGRKDYIRLPFSIPQLFAALDIIEKQPPDSGQQ